MTFDTKTAAGIETEIGPILNQLKPLFKTEPKITLIIRDPEEEEHEILMTNEDAGDVLVFVVPLIHKHFSRG